MEEYLLFASIGGLLFLTVLMNSVAEAYEIKQREKRILILKIKNSMDELSDLYEQLKPYNIPKAINDLLLNEIVLHLQKIQLIDHKFHGIEALLEQASGKSNAEAPPPEPANTIIKTASEFTQMISALRRLIKLLDSSDWYSRVSSEELKAYVSEVILLRCEKIVRFYTDKANESLKNNQFIQAKEDFSYIINTLKISGIIDNPRVQELIEQAGFMKDNISEMMKKHQAKIRLGEDAEGEENNSNDNEENNQTNDKIVK